MLQWCGFSPLWTRRWYTNRVLLANDIPHWAHRCGRSPVWVRMCSTRLVFQVNVLPQRAHWYGFSLLWLIMCAFRFDLSPKDFSQYSHWCGFYSLCWDKICFCNPDLLVNDLSHFLQSCGRSPLCINLCSIKFDLQENVLLHLSHLCGPSSSMHPFMLNQPGSSRKAFVALVALVRLASTSHEFIFIRERW